MRRLFVLALTLLLAVANPAAAANGPRTFATPEEAAQRFAAAVNAGDSKALLEILGPDAKEGKEEILNRRVGRNERRTIQAALAYVDAQREYYLRNPQGDKLLHYAQKFLSASGRRDGLYWPARASERPSPLGPMFAAARAEGYRKGASGKPYPYQGYFYRILKTQGPDARGGAYDYVAQGRMIGGFALVAYPATYANSGVMTFIVNHDGTVYERDLGPDTAKIAKAMWKFNPDNTVKAL